MDIVGLVSGGKDSCYNLMCAVREGHRIVALANLHPPKDGKEELDSYMYQSVGADGVELYGQAMDVPLYRREISGRPVNQELTYEKTTGDEVEDLYLLLKEIKEKHPTVQGVSAGAILSTFQKNRVEEICTRLGLTPICYLWEREQSELLQEMIDNGVDAVLIKVAAIGLGSQHLGKTLKEMQPLLTELQKKYEVHPCGEGGEYETFVRNCPLFKKTIVIDEVNIVKHQDDPVAPVSYLQLKKVHLEDKVTFSLIR